MNQDSRLAFYGTDTPDKEKITKIDLLDHGYVRYIDHMGSDLSIVRSARVSHNADWRAGDNEKSDERLINYLWKNGHTTPFESCVVTFEIQAPIFIFRQWHRHRTQSYNEVSARYTELPELFYTPDPEKIGTQDSKNKQKRDHDAWLTESEFEARLAQVYSYKAYCESSFLYYKELLESGWPRELARMVLPLSTYSRMFATASLLNWFRFISLRDHPQAQHEIQVYAKTVYNMLNDLFPVACLAFNNNKGVEND